jgi:hypothetical protein
MAGEETEGRREDRGQQKGQRAVKETEGHREDGQRGQRAIEGAERRRGDKGTYLLP